MLAKRNSITFRIWLTMNTLILICIIALGSIYLYHAADNLEEGLRSEGITAATTLRSAIALSMLNQDYSSISPLAYSLLDQPNIQYVIVRDQSGKVVNQKGETFTNKDLFIEKVPLLYFNSYLGEIEIALKKDALQSKQNRLYTYTLLIMLLVSAGSMIISVIVSKKLTLPLKELMNAARAMSEGKRHIQVNVEGTVEIKSLSTVFNQMAATIEQNEENLKKEVLRATTRLSEKIKQLKTLGNISQSVLKQNLSHYDVISIILKEIKAFLNPDRLSISLFDDNKDIVTIHYITDNDNIMISEIPLKDTPFQIVANTQKPVIRNDLPSTNIYDCEQVPLRQGIKATISLPLMINDKVMGTLNIGSFQKNFFKENIKEDSTFAVFANQISIALDRVYAYESLRQSAFHDYLTDLPNYRYFKSSLDRALNSIKNHENSYMLAVMFLDLDRFKIINDSLGHDFGDLLLKYVARLIESCVDPDHTVGRIGGDEFIILLPKINDGNDAAMLAEKITRTINRPITISGYEVHVTCSIGIALYPTDGQDSETLIKHADTAMHRVKELGRNNYAIYTPLEKDSTYEQLIFENDLRKALDRNEFTVYYQPKVNIQTGQISGLEALVRWVHPEKGIIAPGKFISIAEETGLIIPIGEFVLRTACEQLAKWIKDGIPPIVVSVNLSTKQFLQTNLVKIVENILKETGLEPNLLELEITESMTVVLNQAIKTLDQLKKLGVQISVDDFGTGYSSLNYLRMLPIDRLKIDRSFIKDITTNEENAAIVSTILSMAFNLNLDVIAEGVEEKTQVDFLQKNNCHEVQGYYFGHPLPANELEEKFPDIQDKAKVWTKNNF
ncbi:MAG TPA: EAL domain-containing protein [Bacillus bacterium]|nr:EAL domain-containing protein [Bacillus sp. (in: firmicutes)]